MQYRLLNQQQVGSVKNFFFSPHQRAFSNSKKSYIDHCKTIYALQDPKLKSIIQKQRIMESESVKFDQQIIHDTILDKTIIDENIQDTQILPSIEKRIIPRLTKRNGHYRQSSSHVNMEQQNYSFNSIEGKYLLPTPPCYKSQQYLLNTEPKKYSDIVNAKTEYENVQFDNEIYQEHKRLNDIITSALSRKAFKDKPQNASLSRNLKRAQISNYLHREFKKAQDRCESPDVSFDQREDLRRHRVTKITKGEQIQKQLNKSSQDNMLNSFEKSNKLLQNSKSVSAQKHSELYLQCYNYFTNKT